MSMPTQTTPLIKVLGIGVAVIAVFLLINAFTSDDKPAVPQGADIGVPRASSGPADSDTPAEELKKVRADFLKLQQTIQELTAENIELKQQGKEIEDRVRDSVKQELEQQRELTDQQAEDLLGKFRSEIDKLGTQQPDQSQTTQPEVPEVVFPEIGDVDDGPGISDGEQPAADEIIWIAPIGQSGEAVAPSVPGVFLPGDGGSQLNDEIDFGDPAIPVSEEEVAEEDTAIKPVYTIPQNATLIDSTAMTALIGRVPFEGSVVDPFKFKLLFGAENLASNGLMIPGIVGMVASGTAQGDWTLSCVRGSVDSLTFTFDDGTIHTVSSAGLGTLSDPFGVPCIPGEKHSNASQFLLGRMFAAGAGALSDAIGQGEIEEEPSEGFGDPAQNIVGSVGTFAATQAIKGAAEELNEYFKERQAQTFDVVLVRSGAKVAIHIDQEIPIDYNPQGRKLAHELQSERHIRSKLD